MRRRLFYLNALLILGIIAAGAALKNRWDEARLREETLRAGGLKPLRSPGTKPIPTTKPVAATNYADVSAHVLFSKDRNPTVIIEKPAPPPEPPVPPLPKVFGMMSIGEPRIVMTDGRGNNQRSYRAGEQVGDFQLVAFDAKTVKFKWREKTIEERVDKLMAEAMTVPTAAPAAPAGAPAPAAAKGPTSLSGTGSTASPGSELGNGTRSCQAGDNLPAGSVSNGMKKVIVANPFGNSCYWEPVK